LAARAWQRGFPAAERFAFVADGAHVNWTIHRKHFNHAVPILDWMHALSYAYSAAECEDDETVYARWANWIWSGRVDRVIESLPAVQRRIGPPPSETNPSDPSSARPLVSATLVSESTGQSPTTRIIASG